MSDKKVRIAQSYYQAMGRKNVADIEQYIHPDVEFVAPLAKTKGKEPLLEGAKRFITVFDTLSIYAKFEDGNKAVIIYDLNCPSPIGSLRTVALMSFKDELISRIELFYDPRPFLK